MSLVLALALVLSMGVTVFAEENSGSTTVTDPTNPENNSKSIDVTAKYEAGNKVYGGDQYYVTISWTETNTLTYKDNTVTYNWDPNKMQYAPTTGDDGKFNGQDVITVKVENRSNKAITANCTVNAASGYTLNTAFDGDSSSLELSTNAPADFKNTDVVESVNGTKEVTISVTTGSAITNDTKVATLTVTIAKKTEG